jgi:serine/tyrosine/threonine adenylyltransferase
MTTSPARARALDTLPFTNRFTAALPADPETANRPRQVHGAAYTRVAPTPAPAPRTLAWSPEVAELLGIDPGTCADQDFADVFSGARVPVGADPYAHCYGGHQFGNWAGQLGDGRAIALGEVRDARGGHQTLQLKGAGLTPYSRSADGRAVLRSSLREFLCSEAMHHLGIPTTRALSLVATGDEVLRDVLYDGNPAFEPGAVVCRVAPSFTRFGSFELPASRGDLDLLERLVRFTVDADLPELRAGLGRDPSVADLTLALFRETCARTADLLVDWMRVGFVHGVLNTDNMSILGLTIDYGPYGWLEDLDPSWTPNTTDAVGRRYRYGAQPQVAGWNLLCLANALFPLVDDPVPFREALEGYESRYRDRFRAVAAARLGWGAPRDGDEDLHAEFLRLARHTETDQVIFHRRLARVPTDPGAGDDALLAPLAGAWYRPEDLAGNLRDGWLAWLRLWGLRARASGQDDAARIAAMDALNPVYVPRNYLAQEAIDAAEAGDTAPLLTLLDVLRHPYTDQPGRDHYAARRPEWARHRVGCSQLSCSS